MMEVRVFCGGSVMRIGMRVVKGRNVDVGGKRGAVWGFVVWDAGSEGMGGV
jgi:hypothetical protein